MELHKIHPEAVDHSLEKARQYRSLLEPEMAISICLDIFAVDKNHQPALIVYILALTDSLAKSGMKKPDKFILDAIKRLDTKYNRFYYEGIFYERKARGLIAHHTMSKSFAYRLLLDAMACYEKAEKLSDSANDDAVLRYNSCARVIENEHLEPRQDIDDEHWQSEA